MEGIFWSAALIAGLTLLVTGIVSCFDKKREAEERLAIAAFIEFIAGWVMYLPDEWYNDTPQGIAPALKTVEVVLTALVKAFNCYFGDGHDRFIREGHEFFSSCYSVTMNLINIAMIFFVAGFILRFIERPFRWFRFLRGRRKDVCFFSACNEKTITIAESVPEKEGKLIVFVDADGELSEKMKQRVQALHAVLMEEDAGEAFGKLMKGSGNKEVFLFGNTEEDNLLDLKALTEQIREEKTSIRIYVEIEKTPWSLYDGYLEKMGLDVRNVVLNFVRTEENFAYNELLKHSIFENAYETEKGREIRFLFVGMNERNLELLKAVLTLGQMPDYRLRIVVIESGSNRSRLRQQMPEIIDEYDREGNAVYRMSYHENVDYASEEFDRLILVKYTEFTTAFVNAGDDLENVRLGLQLQSLCRRAGYSPGKIRVSLQRKEITENWNPKYAERLDFVGDIASTYSYGFITMTELEKAAKAIHGIRQQERAKSAKERGEEYRERSWEEYCNNEYNRHSVYARTLGMKYKVWLIDKDYGGDYTLTQTDRWMLYEHMRWDTYTRTQGYALVPKEPHDPDLGQTDKVAKLHTDLVDYEELSEKLKSYDAITLNAEIEEVLKQI